MDGITFWKLAVGVLATLGLYSVLYRENKFYRLVEHIYIGLAVGFSIVALWTETLESSWWNPMVGKVAEAGTPGTPGFFLYALLLPVGLMGCLVFSQRHSWMSRIPIGIILGFWGGQQLQAFWPAIGPQLQDSMRIVIPSRADSFIVPNGITLSPTSVAEIAAAAQAPPDLVQVLAQNAQVRATDIPGIAQQNGATVEQVNAVISAIQGRIGAEVYPSQAINNLVYLITLISVLCYFLFSFDMKSNFMIGFTRLGRWLLMVGFGAIFGSTVMTRFALLIDRVYFVVIEFFRDAVFRVG